MIHIETLLYFDYQLTLKNLILKKRKSVSPGSNLYVVQVQLRLEGKPIL